MNRFRPALLAAALLLAALARPLRAQIPGNEITQVLASRPVLESLLTRLEDAAQSRDYSPVVREQLRRRALQVRQRLSDGDFHVGDRILLQVPAESTLTDTFTVQAGREVILKHLGPMPLQGVLRSELGDFLTRRLATFLRDPTLRARSLIRVTIDGAVGRQGFYTVPVDIPIDGVLQTAGGPAGNADLGKVRVYRGRDVLYDEEAVVQAITQGTTIDALGIQAGDRFKIEPQPVQSTNPVQRVQMVQYLLALPLSVFALGKLLGF